MRRITKPLSFSGGVLLLGNELARGLVRAMVALAADTATPFEAVIQEGSTDRSWAEHDWLTERLRTFRPAVAVMAVEPRDREAVEQIVKRIEATGAKSFWISLPKRSELSIAMCAKWSAKVWDQITS